MTLEVLHLVYFLYVEYSSFKTTNFLAVFKIFNDKALIPLKALHKSQQAISHCDDNCSIVKKITCASQKRENVFWTDISEYLERTEKIPSLNHLFTNCFNVLTITGKISFKHCCFGRKYVLCYRPSYPKPQK